MSHATLIDGKAVAAQLRERVKNDADAFVRQHRRRPRLAVTLVGEDPASQVYVRNKARAAEKAAIDATLDRLDAAVSQAELNDHVARHSADPDIDGILVQLPLPGHLDAAPVIARIDPDKDVDGLTEISQGRLALGRPGLRPCTPLGCVTLAKHALGDDLSGAHVVVVGRSILVGKPAAQLFLAENCTVTTAHSRTRNLPEVCRGADILVAAVGRAHMIQPDWIKPGACVIDVGINRVASPDGGARLVGDVAFEAAQEVAGAITPVPGGVGPMTIAHLLANTVLAAQMRAQRTPALTS